MALSCVNTDNFLAVALVINRSQDGSAFVFHYPAHVRMPSPEAPDPGDLEDILLERLSQPAHRDAAAAAAAASSAAGVGKDLPRQWDCDEHLVTDSGSQIVPWEHVAGFPARDLAGILTPARPYHKSLFQLSLDPLHCISYPIHVPENGKWKKPKKSSRGKSSSKQNEDLAAAAAAAPDPDIAASRLSDTTKDKDQKKDDVDDEKRSSMTMFNLVFILNPKQTEVKEVVDTLYSHIVRKANKAYKYSQEHSDFVWKESKRILAAKDKAREERKYTPRS
jgi:nitrogen permease regulator 3-like protein